MSSVAPPEELLVAQSKEIHQLRDKVTRLKQTVTTLHFAHSSGAVTA